MVNFMNDIIEKIKNAKSFDEIAEIKQFLYEANIAGDIDIEDVLAGLYKSPTRFIFELLQNAEDAGATNIEINLDEKFLEFCHNGRPFDLKDIKGITGVNKSTKAEDYTKIGAFGIGFKSVFGVCDAPEIYSDNYNFRIKNCYVPERITSRYHKQKSGWTYIVLPLKEDEQAKLYSKIEQTLVDMKPETLLFLNNIHKIDYLTRKHCGFYLKEKSEKSSGGYKYFECVIKGHSGIRSCFYIFEEAANINSAFKVSLAYSFDPETKEIIKDTDSSKVVVFFPTQEDTFLSFRVNGPYQTTKTRESIPETPENLSVLDQTIKLYEKSILCLKDLGLLTISFIEMLPLSSKKVTSYFTNITEGNLFYEAFYEATRKLFLRNKLLPTNMGAYIDPETALLARGPVVDLLSKEDNALLFGNRVNWLSTDITKDKTPMLFEFLSDLKVKVVDFETVLTNLNKSFLSQKDVEWFIKFYTKGNDNLRTIKNHLMREFILTESGKIVAPFIGDKNRGTYNKNVYLPSKLIQDQTKYVAHELLKNKDVRLFFNNIGIEVIDFVECVRTQHLPMIISSRTEEEYFDNFYLLYLEFKDQDIKTKAEVKNLLRENKSILCESKNGDMTYEKPGQCFMSHGESKLLYDGYEQAVFIAEILDKQAQKDKGFFEFLKSLEIDESLVFVEDSNRLTYEEKNAIMQTNNWTDRKDTAYTIWGLNYILEHITIEKSKLLWNKISNLNEAYFKGVLRWQYHTWNKKEFEAYFLKTLQKTKWLYNTQKELVSPEEIYEDEVRALYGGGNAIKHFKFKPDLIKQLPPEDQQRMEMIQGIPLDVLSDFAEQYRQLSTPQEVHIEPEKNPVEIEDAEFENARNPLTAAELTETKGEEIGETAIVDTILDELYGNSDIPDEVIEKIVVKRTTNEAELDGDLGERFVISSLKKASIKQGCEIFNETEGGFVAKKGETLFDVRRHNSAGKVQKGYDITVAKNGEIIQYIEVKSKKSAQKELFKVSGLQWEFAKKLYEEGNGDNHFVYVVSNVRNPEKTKITKVSNPYKAWLEGRLEADPVRIKY